MTPRKHHQFERIEPVARDAPATRSPRSRQTAKSAAGRWAAGLAIFAVAVLAAVLLLLRSDGDPDVAKTASTVDEAGERLQSQAAKADAMRRQLYRKWLRLEGMNVETWSSLRAERARELLQQGEKLTSELDHLNALRVFGQSDELLSALIDEAPGIAADRREAGWQAFRAGDAETAAEHFRVVLAIDPGDTEVREALNQTGYLPTILALSRRARGLEDDGDLAGALEAMNEALRIDPANAEVSAEVARLEGALADARFQTKMSGAYTAIGARRYTAAREMLRNAAAIRPNSPEVRDAGIQIDLAVRAARTSALREQAEQAEQREDWEDAIGFYGELLEIDPALVLAQQGRDRARRLASLMTRAEALLETREFFKDDVKRRAKTLLEQIDTVAADAPALRARAVLIGEELAMAQQPVTVRLQSDNATEIVVFRVGRLGVFDSRELELLPGRYTVVGTRDGYRDVRRELVVQAGRESASLEIRCEEQI